MDVGKYGSIIDNMFEAKHGIASKQIHIHSRLLFYYDKKNKNDIESCTMLKLGQSK